MVSTKSGYFGCLTPEEEAVKEELRKKLPLQSWYTNDPRFNDLFLLRFCRARNFEVPLVLEMLRKDHEWRTGPVHAHSDMTVTEILEQTPTPETEKKVQSMKKYYSTGYHGIDRFGRPIYIDRIGQLDMTSLLREVSEADVIEHFVRESEAVQKFYLPCSTLHSGKVVETTLNILDLKGLGFRSATDSVVRRVAKACMQIPQDHYPETMGVLYVVNPPKVFSIVWSIVQPMLHERTRAKVHFINNLHGENPLLQDVAAEDLPTWLGGTCECVGGCLSRPKGPWCDSAILKKLDEHNYYDIQSELFSPTESVDPVPAESVRTPSIKAVSEAASSSGLRLSLSFNSQRKPQILPPYYYTLTLDESRIRSRSDYDDALAELAKLEEQHMNALRQWSKIQLELTIETQPYVINRAAPYYDAYIHQKKCAKEVTDFTLAFHRATKEFDTATQSLREVELEVENVTDPEERSKLIWRVCELADEVTRCQRERDHSKVQASVATVNLNTALTRWNTCRAEHDFCTYNCSVIKARKYYDVYQDYDELLSGQMDRLEEAEEYVAEAKTLCQYIRQQEAGEEFMDADDTRRHQSCANEPEFFAEVKMLDQIERDSVSGDDWVSLGSSFEEDR